MPETPYKKQYNRLKVAIKLADVLHAMGAFSWTIRECADADGVWNNAAKLANNAANLARFTADYSPSQETREVALQLMMDREEIETRLKEATRG